MTETKDQFKQSEDADQGFISGVMRELEFPSAEESFQSLKETTLNWYEDDGPGRFWNDIQQGVIEAPWQTAGKFNEMVTEPFPNSVRDYLRETPFFTTDDQMRKAGVISDSVTGDLIGEVASTGIPAMKLGSMATKLYKMPRMTADAISGGLIEAFGKAADNPNTVDAVLQLFGADKDSSPLIKGFMKNPDDPEYIQRTKNFLSGFLDATAIDKVVDVLRPVFRKYNPENQVNIRNFENDPVPAPVEEVDGTVKSTVKPPKYQFINTRKIKPNVFEGKDLDFRDVADFRTSPIGVNYDRINSPDDIKQLIQEIATVIEKKYPKGTHKKRGVQSKAGKIKKHIIDKADVTQAEADITALAGGMDKVALMIKGETENLDATTLALRHLLVDSISYVKSMTKLLQDSRSDVSLLTKAGFNSREQAKVELRKAMVRHTAFQSHVQGITTNIARALAAHRYHSKSTLNQTQNIAQILDTLGGSELNEKLIDHLSNMDSPEQLSTMLRHSFIGKTGRSLIYMAINGMLSLPKTQMANSFGSTAMLMLQQAEHMIAAGVGSAERLFIRTKGGITFSEAGAMSFGFNQAFLEMIGLYGWEGVKQSPLGAGIKAFKRNGPDNVYVKDAFIPHNPITAENWDVSTPYLRKAIDYLGVAVGLPGRLLMSNDEVFKAFNYRMHLHSLAMRKAMADGLQGEELQGRYLSYLRELPEDIHLEAQELAAKGTFANPFKEGSLGRGFEKLRSGVETPSSGNAFERNMKDLGKFAGTSGVLSQIPFFRTLIRLLQAGVLERGPLGIFGAITKDPAKRQLAIAKTITGAGLIYAGYNLAASGNIKFINPRNRTQFQQKVIEGSASPSLDLGDKEVGLQQLDPIIPTITMGGLLHAYLKQADQAEGLSGRERLLLKNQIEHAFSDTAYTFRNIITEKTLLKNVNDIISIANAETKADIYKPLVNYLEFINPASSFFSSAIRGINKSIDPTQYEKKVSLVPSAVPLGETEEFSFKTDKDSDYQADDMLEYIWKTHLRNIEEKYAHVFSYDNLRVPRLDMLGYPLGSSRESDPLHPLHTTLVPGLVKDKPTHKGKKSLLHKYIMELGNLAPLNLKHPSTWQLIKVSNSGTYVIPLEPKERHAWAKRFGELNRQLEHRLRTEKKMKLKSEGGKLSASELAMEIADELRGNKDQALDDFIYEKDKKGNYIRPALVKRYEYLEEIADEARSGEIQQPFLTQ